MFGLDVQHSQWETIDVAITTVARSKDYIHELLASLPDFRLRLVVGSPEVEYLQRYRDNPFLTVSTVLENEWREARNYSLHQRASWNYWRCLVTGPRNSQPRGLLLLEDDVIPARGWEGRFFASLQGVELESEGGPFVLSLYAADRCLFFRGCSQLVHCHYPIHRFYGTQGMYYPEAVRSGFASYLRENGVDAFRIPYDELLKEYLLKRGIPLFATIPSLVQHEGAISTGLGNFFHQSPYFRRDLLQESQ